MINSSEYMAIINSCMDLFYKYEREFFDDFFLGSLNDLRGFYKELKTEMDYLSSFPATHVKMLRPKSDPQFKDCPYPEDMLEKSRDIMRDIIAVCKITNIKYEFVQLDSHWYRKGKYAFFKIGEGEDTHDITEIITLQYEKQKA